MADTADVSWLAPLVELSQFGGDWPSYCDALYAHFARDFLSPSSTPVFRGVNVSAPKHGSLPGAKNGTFWHIVSDGRPGTLEADRLPNLRRAERIRWIRQMIDNANDTSRVVSWADNDRGDPRWVLALADFTYKVVLKDRATFMTLLTGFPVEFEHSREKTRNEYLKARAAAVTTPKSAKPPPHGGGFGTPSTHGR